MRYLSTLLLLLICAIGCQGPISDWPHSGSGDEGTGSAPIAQPGQGGGANGGPVVPGVGAGGAGATGGAGGAVGGGNMTPVPPASVAGGGAAGTGTGSMDAGVSTPGQIGGAATGGLGGFTAGSLGGLAGGTGGGSGAPPPMGSSDAAAASDGGVPEAGVDGAVDAGAHDGGCAQPSAPDASMCPGYGCRTTLQQLRTSMKQGACSSEQAAAVVCDGRVGNVALQCTQDNLFALNISRAVNGCLKRDPQIGMLANDCVDCFVEEALCTLTRCFAACAVNDGNDCTNCRQQQCSAMFADCSGLPAPSFGP